MLIIPGVEVDERRLADICDRYGIAKLKIFGSQARGARFCTLQARRIRCAAGERTSPPAQPSRWASARRPAW
jgi:hypothetical protein